MRGHGLLFIIAGLASFTACTSQSAKEEPPSAPSASGPGISVASESADQAKNSKGAVWVQRSDGGLNCKPQSGQGLGFGAEELRKGNIQVFDARKGSDGKMHAQMCGLPSGSENSFLISRKDLGRAEAMGYRELPLRR